MYLIQKTFLLKLRCHLLQELLCSRDFFLDVSRHLATFRYVLRPLWSALRDRRAIQNCQQKGAAWRRRRRERRRGAAAVPLSNPCCQEKNAKQFRLSLLARVKKYTFKLEHD
jgi:hypothetical protein